MTNLRYELNIEKKGFNFVGGIDEAGRGPLAGPVVAAAVILKKTKFNKRIDDSKLLSPLQRQAAYYEIMDSAFVGIGVISENIIDTYNILKATYWAMENAVYSCVYKLNKSSGSQRKKIKLYFLIDGTNINLNIPYKFKCIIGGDKKSISISAASIVAKVERDRIMQIYDKTYPLYAFRQHKGYATSQHVLKLKKFGASTIHRRSFFPVKADIK